jgi:hypothetical protein
LVSACPDSDDDPGPPDAGSNNNNSVPILCGDGSRNGVEACDEGSANSDSQPDACRTDCTLPRCGDSVVDSGETCDEGPQNSSAPDAECRPGCLLRRCGDGILDYLSGEACDSGAENADLPNVCRTTCLLPACGDGILDTSYAEACDLGAQNTDAPDADCRPDCTLQRCGDEVIDPLAGEECDNGLANADQPNQCRPTCLQPRCGDGIVDTYTEQCDLGSSNSNQPDADCRLDCTPQRCGDGILDPEAGETCDATLLGQEMTCADAWGPEYVGCTRCNGDCHSANTCILCPTCGLISWCIIQWPGFTSTHANVASEAIYGRVYAPGISAATIGQVGYGTPGTDPMTHSSWHWFGASINPSCYDCGDNTEYTAPLLIPTAGTYAYAYRFTTACAGTGPWVYCDTGGVYTGGTGSFGSIVVVNP